MNPKISVIIPTYNSEEYIEFAIKSVFSQTLGNFELIIVDDCSTDNTLKLIRQFKDSRMKIILHQSNKGICEARNTGLKESEGEWIALLDADDGWHEEYLERLYLLTKKYPNSFFGSDFMVCFSGANNEFVPYRSYLKMHEYDIRNKIIILTSLGAVKLGLHLPMFPRDIVVKNNIMFPSEYRGYEGLYFILYLIRYGLKYVIINEPLYYYRLTPGSLSVNYLYILGQLKTCEYLLTQEWVNDTIRKILKEVIKVIRYRLFTTSLKEKCLNRALHHLFSNPESIFYLFYIFPRWLTRKRNQRLGKLGKFR